MLAPTAPRPLSILSPGKDFFFFFASTFVVLFVWVAAVIFHVNSFYVLATVAVVANGPHLVSTWTRVYFDKREWKDRPLLIIGVPLAIATAVTLISAQLGFTGARILNSAILYWATWHFVAQNWGLLRIYQRKSGEDLTSLALSLEKPILFGTVLFALGCRIQTGPRVLFGTEVFTPHFSPLAVQVSLAAAIAAFALHRRDAGPEFFQSYWLPLGCAAFLPAAIAAPYAVLAPVVLSAVVLVALRLKDRGAPHARAAWVRLAFLGCSALGFIVPFLFIKTDDTSAFAAAACWHGVQYLGIVRHYHRTTWRDGVDSNAKVVSWLSQPGKARAALYVALLLALAGSGYVVIGLGSYLTRGTAWDAYRWGSVVWISLTLSHYWLDGVIWKLRRPEVAARVGIEPA
jgi:hypothetical protein